MKAQGNHNLDETLRLLSKEVDFRTFVKLKALTNASDSEFLNGQLFEFFRKRQGDIPFSEVLSLPSEAINPFQGKLLSWLVRWRRLLEPWEGEALHSAIGEIKWGLSRGMGEDLAEYLSKAMQLAQKQSDFPAMLEILGLERQVVMTYWATGEKRVKRLTDIQNMRKLLIQSIRTGAEEAKPNIPWQRETEDLPHRVKSNLLHRLCNTLNEEECEELRRHIHLHRKDAKQFRLLEYYRQMAEWSREQEKKDWEDENLSQLKSNTLAWLMRNMTRYGAWHEKELHHLLGDLKWAISKGIEPHLEGHFQKACFLCKELELHDIAIDLVAIWKEHFMEAFKLSDLEAWALNQLEEVELVHSLRLEYFEPIRMQNKASGFNQIEAWRSFWDVLSDEKWELLSASNATREIGKFRILACISLKDVRFGEKAARDMLMLHKTRPLLASTNLVRYFEESRLCCLALVLAGDHNEAIKIVEEMQLVETLNKTSIPHSIHQRLLALSYIYDATLDQRLAEWGIDIFYKSKHLLSKADDRQKHVWLLWFVAKATLDLGKFSESKELLNELIDHKNVAPQILVAHCRVRLLLTLLGNLIEPEVVYNASNACMVFLKRNTNTPKYLQQIVQLVKKIAAHEIGSKEQINALEVAAIESKTIYEGEVETNGLAFRYHLAFSMILNAIKSYR